MRLTTPLGSPLTCWVVTNMRLSGRLSTGRTVDLAWSQMRHGRVDLSRRGKDWLTIAGWGTNGVLSYRIGTAPLAIAAMCKVYGALALSKDPVSARLRVESRQGTRREGKVLAHDPTDDLLPGP